MKTSELISLLQDLVQKHGDRYVVVFEDLGGDIQTTQILGAHLTDDDPCWEGSIAVVKETP